MEQSLIDTDKLVESMMWRDDQGMISSIDDVLDTIDVEDEALTMASVYYD